MGRGVAAQPPRSAGGAGGSEVGTAADEPGAGAKRRSRERKRTDRASGAAPPGGTGGARIHQGNAGGQGRAPGNHRRQSNRAAHQQHTDGTQETKVTKTYRDSRKQGTFYPLRILRGYGRGIKQRNGLQTNGMSYGYGTWCVEKLPPCYSTGVSSSSCLADGKRFGQNTVYLRASLGVFLSMESVQRQEEKTRHEESKE